MRQAQSLDFLIEWVGSRSQLGLDLHLQFSQCVSAVQAVVPPTPRPQARVLADQPVLSIKIGVAKCASCRILYSLVVAFDDDGGLTYQPNDCPAALAQESTKSLVCGRRSTYRVSNVGCWVCREPNIRRGAKK